MDQYILAIAAIVGLMTIWYFVQVLWLRIFPEYRRDVDALALREGCCHGCENEGCSTDSIKPTCQASLEV